MTLSWSSSSSRTMSRIPKLWLMKRLQIVTARLLFGSRAEVSLGKLKRSLVSRNPSRVTGMSCDSDMSVSVHEIFSSARWDRQMLKHSHGENASQINCHELGRTSMCCLIIRQNLGASKLWKTPAGTGHFARRTQLLNEFVKSRISKVLTGVCRVVISCAICYYRKAGLDFLGVKA